MTQPIRIMLVEDQTIIRQGLRYILDSQPDLKVVGEAADGEEAVLMTRRLKPDIVMMDIRLPGQDGIAATRSILKVLPETKIILLTTFDVQEYVYDGIRAGAVGYILKDAETRDLLDAIRAAQRGGVIYRSISSREAITRAIQEGKEIPPSDQREFSLLEPLTGREREVLQQMAFGKRNSEIAGILSISEGTVKTHVHRILQKFGTDDRTQAVVLAIRQHIVQ